MVCIPGRSRTGSKGCVERIGGSSVIVNRKYGNIFASSGSCHAPELYIKGKVKGITFTSEEFTGTMDGQEFWNRLREFAHSKNAFVYLMY